MWALLTNDKDRMELQQNLVPAPIACPDFETEEEAETFLTGYVLNAQPISTMERYLVINKTYKIVNE